MEASMQSDATRPSEPTMETDVLTRKTHGLIASDRVEGTPMCRSNGETIGTIQRLMIDKLSGRVAYVILSFGGILGMGRKHLPVPWARMQYSTALEAYAIDLTDEELAEAPSYAADMDFDWGDRELGVEIDDYYKVPRY